MLYADMYMARRFQRTGQADKIQKLRDLAKDGDEKIVKLLIKALLTAIIIEDVSSDPKERILVTEEAEKLFIEHLKGKKDSYKRLGEKIQLKKGEVSMNFLSKEKLQSITSVLMRDTKNDKAFQAKVLTLLGSYYQKQADFQKASDYFDRSASLIKEEYGNEKHHKLVHIVFY